MPEKGDFMDEMKHIYSLDIVMDGAWRNLVEDTEDIRQVDKKLYQLTKLTYHVSSRVLRDGKVWVFLDNSDYQYLYWKNVYVRQKGPRFNPEKIYGKKLRKPKKD